jgi:glyoxylase I family protein
MRSGTNPVLSGGALHHVAVGASDFEASLRFYVEGLGFRLALRFPEEPREVALLDTGGGTYLELFSGGAPSGEGPILHLALATDDCEASTERARAAGACVVTEPSDMVLLGERPVPCRYSFVEGPDGVCIELIQMQDDP